MFDHDYKQIFIYLRNYLKTPDILQAVKDILDAEKKQKVIMAMTYKMYISNDIVALMILLRKATLKTMLGGHKYVIRETLKISGWLQKESLKLYIHQNLKSSSFDIIIVII